MFKKNILKYFCKKIKKIQNFTGQDYTLETHELFIKLNEEKHDKQLLEVEPLQV